MKNLYVTTLRLNLDNAEEREAWEHLRRLDRAQYRSVNRAVVAAVNAYFGRQEQLAADPYLETREKEETFLREIREAIRQGLREAAPTGLVPLLQLVQGAVTANQPPRRRIPGIWMLLWTLRTAFDSTFARFDSAADITSNDFDTTTIKQDRSTTKYRLFDTDAVSDSRILLSQGGFSDDRERKEAVAGEAPFGGSRGPKPGKGAQGADTAADSGGGDFGESHAGGYVYSSGCAGGLSVRQDKSKLTERGRSGQPGRPPFLCSRRAHLLTTRKRAVVCLRHRALCEADAASADASRQCHSSVGAAVIVCAVGSCFCFGNILPTACKNLPPAAFVQLWTASRRPFSFCEKETKTRTTGR